jgi:hypothetical protein
MKEKTSSIYPPVCVGPHNTASSTPYLGEEEKQDPSKTSGWKQKDEN